VCVCVERGVQENVSIAVDLSEETGGGGRGREW
jgi:hypothetical protein